MTKQEALPLRILIPVLAFGTFVIQILLIPQAGDRYADRFPEAAYLASPYATAIAVGFIGFEVALLAAWQLVSAVQTDRALNRRTARWTNVMAASLGFMAAVFACVCAHALFWAEFGSPAVFFGLLVSLGLFACVFVVRNGVRSWLENGAGDRTPQ